MLQCGAVWCSVVQCGAVWCSMRCRTKRVGHLEMLFRRSSAMHTEQSFCWGMCSSALHTEQSFCWGMCSSALYTEQSFCWAMCSERLKSISLRLKSISSLEMFLRRNEMLFRRNNKNKHRLGSHIWSCSVLHCVAVCCSTNMAHILRTYCRTRVCSELLLGNVF